MSIRNIAIIFVLALFCSQMLGCALMQDSARCARHPYNAQIIANQQYWFMQQNFHRNRWR